MGSNYNRGHLLRKLKKKRIQEDIFFFIKKSKQKHFGLHTLEEFFKAKM